MRFIHLIFTCLFIMLQGGTPLAAQGLSKHLGPLAGLVELGQDGAWTTSVEGGWFNMANSSDANSLRYYITDFPELNGGKRQVQVNAVLRGLGQDVSYAGVVFDWKSHSEYFAFLIGSDGSVMAVERTADGVQTYPAEDGIRARLDGSDVITLSETPTQVEMFLNGASVFVTDSENGFSRNYGVVAVGTGRFAYTGFSVQTEAGQGGFPSPGTADTGGGANPFPAPGGGQTPAPAPAPAPAGGGVADLPAEQQTTIKAILGTTLSVFMHEFAHALIGETGLPATGPEEDTADAYSAIMLAGAVGIGAQTTAESSFSEQMVEYGTLFWYFNGLANQNSAPGADDWQDEHAPDLKRFRNGFCLMYGMTPAIYEDVADLVGFGANKRARCQEDAAKQLNAWMQILATIERNTGPGSNGAKPANAPGGGINVRFDDPGDSAAGQVIKAFMGDSGQLQTLMNGYAQIYVLPRDLQVTFTNCADLNAWYDPETHSITLCYALFDYTTSTVLQGLGQGGGAASPASPAPAPPAQAPQGFNDAETFVTGLWEGQMIIGNQSYPALLFYDTDRSYGFKFDSPYGEIIVAGTWSAEVIGDLAVRVWNTPQDWKPKQLCDGQNNCVANSIDASESDVQIIDQNTITSEGVTWRRIQQ